MFEILNSYVDRGLLKRQVSPDGVLVLYDYTEKCQYDKAWDEITLNHRGTVYSLETGEIVARSFPKFFNFSEFGPTKQEAYARETNFSVYEKLDGSLGIVYYYNGWWRVNTRGSFSSDQAIRGAHILNQMDFHLLDTENTYLVEIIYPENRIVVDYKGAEKVVLLGIMNTKTGKEYEITDSRYDSFEEAKRYNFDSISEVLAKLKTLPYNEEGYVVRFQDGTRAKFKGDEYVEMHRVVTGLSPLVLWENMENGRVSDTFLSNIPEEFRPQYIAMAEELEMRASDVMHRVEYYAQQIAGELFSGKFEVTGDNRKTLGLYLKENECTLNQYIFPYFLGKGVWEMVQKEIRPTGNKL
jgi:RNA ligase